MLHTTDTLDSGLAVWTRTLFTQNRNFPITKGLSPLPGKMMNNYCNEKKKNDSQLPVVRIS